MITIKDFMECIDYRISGGADFTWTKCFGPFARFIDSESDSATISMVFDSKDQTVYMLEIWDYKKNKEFRLINPLYIEGYKRECESRNLEFRTSTSDRTFIDLDDDGDALRFITAILNGEEYDSRVTIPIELDDDELLYLMKIAHEKDITFNQLVEEMITNLVEERKEDGN